MISRHQCALLYLFHPTIEDLFIDLEVVDQGGDNSIANFLVFGFPIFNFKQDVLNLRFGRRTIGFLPVACRSVRDFIKSSVSALARGIVSVRSSRCVRGQD